MRRVLEFLFPILLTVSFFAIIFLLAGTVVAAIVFGLARLLMWFLPFTLFEAAVVTAILIYFTLQLLLSAANFLDVSGALTMPGARSGRRTNNRGNGRASRISNRIDSTVISSESESDDDEEKEYKRIAPERFYKSPELRTWTAWLREEIANDTYSEFQDTPNTIRNMNEMQQQELAVRLAEIAVDLLKRKSARARDLSVNVSALKREMTRIGQRAYDDDILKLATNAINLNTSYYEESILAVIRDRSWDEVAEEMETEE